MTNLLAKIEQIKQFLEKEPDDSFLLHALALEYVKQGKNEEARVIFERTLNNDADYLGSYYQLGKLLEKTNDYETAIEWYKKGMAIAEKLKDRKAYNELRTALEEILEDE